MQFKLVTLYVRKKKEEIGLYILNSITRYEELVCYELCIHVHISVVYNSSSYSFVMALMKYTRCLCVASSIIFCTYVTVILNLILTYFSGASDALCLKWRPGNPHGMYIIFIMIMGCITSIMTSHNLIPLFTVIWKICPEQSIKSIVILFRNQK